MESIASPSPLTSAASLAWINARVSADASLTRYRLAKELCVRLDLRDAKGRPREMACRRQLLALRRLGRIELPPPGHKPPSLRPVAPGDTPVWPEFTGTLAALGPVTLRPVTGGTQASHDWNAMLRAHHPRGAGPLCGAQIRYLIVSEQHGILGGLAVNAAAWRLRARDAWLGWTDAERAEKLQGIICNSRFLIRPTIRVKHLASHVLGQLARRIRADWRDRYGRDPWLMETCVEATHAGTCYRAANWSELGLTAGRGRQDGEHKAKSAAKRVFVYPLDPATLKRLRPDRPATPPGWVHREFGGAKLGDHRLSQRLLDLGAAFFAQPQANIPQACGSTAAAKAAYRFFDNDRVTMDALLEPHHQATIARMRHEPVVLVAQDTTSLCYTTHPGTKGLGPISNKVNGPQGIEVHSAQAFTPAGLPLGVLDIEAWARDPAEFGKRKDSHAKPIEDKESIKWLRALQPIGAAAARCPNSRVVTLADREADIHEYLLDAHRRGLEAVVRAKEKDRRLDGEVLKLWPHMLARPKAGTIELTVPRHGKEPARPATLSVSFDTVTLKPPHAKKHLPPLRVVVVLSREEAPPPGVKDPLEWLLLSTAPRWPAGGQAVASLADAVERIQWYACRWGIEVFHRILKSGCQIEDRQLGTADRLEACLAIDAVVAWRIHHLTYLGRVTPDLPRDTVFEDDLWKGVIVFRTRRPPPEKPPSLREMIRMIAGLGGFLGRQSDGEPGTQTLWRGPRRADDIAIMFRGVREAYTLPS
ncbi:MAG TPA: IS4 family transposase [Reyranella sp.]|nr:IS4 family transposase [Reyranella sp.]